MPSQFDQNKTKPTDVSPAAHVGALENDVRRRDAERLLVHFEKLTGEKPNMWGSSIIGFGTYRYRYDSGREGEMFLAGFAPRKTETVVYLMGEIPDQAELLSRLGRHKAGKSCLYIKDLEEIDLAVLTELVVKSVAALKEKYPVL